MLVRWNVPGSLQLYLAAPGTDVLRQLTELDEPVDGRFVPGSRRLLLSVDAGGNERAQLYLADPEPGAPHEPLVVEPDFLHLTPRLSPDGTLLSYACNRRNGQDLDVFVHTLATAPRGDRGTRASQAAGIGPRRKGCVWRGRGS